MISIKVTNVTACDSVNKKTSKILPRVRFDVTILDGEEALCTMKGFLYDAYRNLSTHGKWAGRGMFFFSDISDRVASAILEYLDSSTGVQDHLGPPRRIPKKPPAKVVDGGGKLKL